MELLLLLSASRQLFPKAEISSTAQMLCGSFHKYRTEWNVFEGILPICIVLVYPKCFLILASNSCFLEKYFLSAGQTNKHQVPICRAHQQFSFEL